MECDARRHLRFAAGPGRESLERIRVRLGGRRGERDALEQEERQRMEEFVANHPEYGKKVDDWRQAESRWVSDRGRRPRPPSTEYDD